MKKKKDDTKRGARNANEAKWYHYIVQVLLEISSNIGIIVTILYFSLLDVPIKTIISPSTKNFHEFHAHIINGNVLCGTVLIILIPFLFSANYWN